jgi:transcriptional regulator with XRE-family HTH domain
MGSSRPAGLEDLGLRLRERRSELGRTMSGVAREAEVSVSYLSGIEAGANVPSLPVLARIVRVLGLSMAEVLRSGASTPVTTGRYDPDQPGLHPIASDALRLRVFSMNAAPGETGDAPFELGTAVLVHVRSGALRIAIDDDEHALAVGDTLHASHPAAMRWSVPEDARCSCLWVTLRPPG